MTQVIPKSRSRKVNGYMKAVLALEGVRRKREDRYDRFVRPLDRKRDELVVEVAARVKALSGGQYAEAQRILGANTALGPPGKGASMSDRVIRTAKDPTIVEAHRYLSDDRPGGNATAGGGFPLRSSVPCPLSFRARRAPKRSPLRGRSVEEPSQGAAVRLGWAGRLFVTL
jgi:hypothetical protein